MWDETLQKWEACPNTTVGRVLVWDVELEMRTREGRVCCGDRRGADVGHMVRTHVHSEDTDSAGTGSRCAPSLRVGLEGGESFSAS